MFPNAIVRGVDLFPPPVTWMPPNCIMEVDDVLQELAFSLFNGIGTVYVHGPSALSGSNVENL
jgi:hypothetical protein